MQQAGVSIHARQFHSGRQTDQRITGTLSLFQSTPANFTAGDHADAVDDRVAALVSIHARQFHSGRPSSLVHVIFNDARFNPRPPISQRATVDPVAVTSAVTTFQSTPANFTAGDPLVIVGRLTHS